MSAHLEKARQRIAAGKFRAALDSIYYALPVAQEGDLDEARAILELVAELEAHAEHRFQSECAEIRELLNAVFTREGDPAREIEAASFAFLSDCRLIGCAGIPAEPDTRREWCLAFTDERVTLVAPPAATPADVIDLGWRGLTVEVQGAGEVRGGDGAAAGLARDGAGRDGAPGAGGGAAVTMLPTAAVDALSASSHVDTTVHLRTAEAEAYLFYSKMTPPALRRVLSPVFDRVWHEAAAAAAASASATPSVAGPAAVGPAATSAPASTGDGSVAASAVAAQTAAAASAAVAANEDEHVIDRLHKLADLLDRGLIDEAEFSRLKDDLLREVAP